MKLRLASHRRPIQRHIPLQPRSYRIKKVLRVVFLVLALLLALAAFGYFELTAHPNTSGIQTPNPMDASEARQKVNLLKTALEESRQGYIRMLPVELNSLLNQRLNSQFKEGDDILAPGQSRLTKFVVDFNEEEIYWYCWVDKNWFGYTTKLVWQRQVDLIRTQDKWEFRTLSMQVGRLNIPSSLWPMVRRTFARADQQFAKQVEWLTQLPALEFTVNRWKLGQEPEIRLYSYPEPDVLRSAR